MSAAPVIERVAGRAFRIPTDAPEADGTLAWDHTTAVIVEASAAGVTGLGYSYTGAEAAALINNTLAAVVVGREAFAIPTAWEAMVRSIRNLGWRGICATAISAIDAALWDLKARLLGRPAPPSATPACSSTPTAPMRASRRCALPSTLPNST